MTDIFISYARDDQDKAKALATELTRSGYAVWWDQHIGAGADFARDIERQLLSAKAVIVIWTKAAAQSHWVKDEADAAQRRGVLIPLKFDASEPPLGFRQFQTIDFSAWDKRPDRSPYQRLIEVLQTKINDDGLLRRPLPSSFKSQRVKYCRSADGTSLAYARMGSGPPVVKAGNLFTHIDLDAQSFVFRHLFDSLAEHYELIRYDLRGMGLSDWNVASISFEDYLADMETVIDAAGLDRFALLGFSQGCPLSIAYAARHPERVTCIALTAAYAKGWRMRLSPSEQKREAAFLDIVESSWGDTNPVARQMFTTTLAPNASREEMDTFNAFLAKAASADNVVRNLNAMSRIDISGLLKDVSSPTRLFHFTNDTMNASISEARFMASEIPDADLISIEGDSHLILENDPAWPQYIDELNSFLAMHNH